MVGVAQHIGATAIGAYDFVARIRIDMQIDARMTQRTAAAIARDLNCRYFNGFVHSAR